MVSGSGHLITGQMAGTSPAWSTTVAVPSGTRNGRYLVTAACMTDEGEPYALYDPTEFDVLSPAGQQDPVVRIAGENRVATAIAASRDAFPDNQSALGAVLSRADSYADALAGTPLVETIGGPLLLTNGDQLDSATELELQRVVVPNGQIAVLGGTAAVGDSVVSRLQAMGFQVTRYAGVNRYDTAAKIASEAIVDVSRVMLADGNGFHDGLVAGAAANADTFGGVVLLTNGSQLPPETKGFLDSHGGIETFAVGAPAAAADPSAIPLVGADDAETSVKVADRFFPRPIVVGLASMATFPDALSGGAHLDWSGGPLLLTDPHGLPGSVAGWLQSKKSVAIGFVYGGTAAVDEAVVNAAAAAIT